MKTFIKFTILLPLITSFISCSNQFEQSGYLKYDMKTFKQFEGDTTKAGKGYVKVKLVYPEITDATNPAIKDVLIGFVKDQILTAPFKEGRYKEPQFLIDNFIKEYHNFIGEGSGAPPFWTLDRRVDVTFSSNRIVSFLFFDMSYLGGAHPNTNYFYTLYDLVTGGKLKAKDIFIEGYEAKLTPIAEKIFKEKRSIKEDADLKTEGFDFPNNKFQLNNNIGFTKEGVVFFYNAYEVAPYYMGSTEVLIPYDKIKDLFVKAFLPLEEVNPNSRGSK